MISAEDVINEFRLRVFEESYTRIEICLNRISEDQFWKAPNDNCVSIGCLIKHLIGNIQQWVYSGVLGGKFIRDRESEFIPETFQTKEDLISQMEVVRDLIDSRLPNLDSELLRKNLIIQGFQTTGYSAISHAIEHFSYHTGQIALLTKLLVNQDLGFYNGYELN